MSLIGHFNQVDREHQHFLMVAAVTGSGIHIQEWVERLPKEKEVSGLVSGFMFLKKDGSPAGSFGGTIGVDPAQHGGHYSSHHKFGQRVWSALVRETGSHHGSFERGHWWSNH
jgi:hypothetical protein